MSEQEVDIEKLKKQARRQRVSFWLLAAITFVLLAGIIVLQIFAALELFPTDPTSDNLWFFALSSFNFVAFIVFAFIFLRNFVKLRRERRARELGSKIKTKFLAYFIFISILPIITLGLFSYLSLNRSIQKWLSPLPVIEEAEDVQKRAIEEQKKNTQNMAQAIASLLDHQPETIKEVFPTKQPETISEELLTTLAARSNLVHISVVSSDGTVVSSVEPNLSAKDRVELKQILDAARTNSADPILTDNQGFDVALAQLHNGRTLIVVPQRRNEANVSEAINDSRFNFYDLKRRQQKVISQGLSTLSLLTLLLLVASSWTAFYLARGIATPIKELAEASKEVARGNFAHRVDTHAEDELALLVSSFNQMTAQLEENRKELEANDKELREKNIALEEGRAYIETVLKSLSTGVISLDENDCVTTINAAAAMMLHIEDTHSCEHSPLSSVLSDDDRAILERLVRRARRMGRATEQTELGRNSNGANSTLPAALTATALHRPQEGKTGGVVIVIEDLSELLAAQRAAAWSEVAQRMAHEIKNPLTPIQLSAERIAKNYMRYYGDSENGPGGFARVINDCIATITREVAGLKGMVDEFSRFARLPHAKLEPADLNEIVRQAISLYEDRLNDARLDVRLGQALPQAMLDPEQLRRAFVNLIDNALEALDQIEGDKRVTVATAHDHTRGILLAEITDSGHGIASEDFPKLFQPYFSTKGRGTGLGLAIVQRIIIEHGGKIKAESNKPRGARFVIELPVASA
jgi:nitrogen fixation/metabolism regulation signal transduction histidine kinase